MIDLNRFATLIVGALFPVVVANPSDEVPLRLTKATPSERIALHEVRRFLFEAVQSTRALDLYQSLSGAESQVESPARA